MGYAFPGMYRSLALSRGILAGRSWLGRLLALAALAVQLAAASVVPWSAASAAPAGFGLDAPICHAGGAVQPGGGAPLHHGHDCILCPLCLTVAQAAAVLAPGPVALPAPSVSVRNTLARPPAQAPPRLSFFRT